MRRRCLHHAQTSASRCICPHEAPSHTLQYSRNVIRIIGGMIPRISIQIDGSQGPSRQHIRTPSSLSIRGHGSYVFSIFSSQVFNLTDYPSGAVSWATTGTHTSLLRVGETFTTPYNHHTICRYSVDWQSPASLGVEWKEGRGQSTCPRNDLALFRRCFTSKGASTAAFTKGRHSTLSKGRPMGSSY